MSAVTAQAVRDEVLARLASGLRAKGLDAGDVGDDFDLLAEGVVDSFGLLELIGALEASLGVELDFEDVDADELTVLGSFTRHVELQAREQGDAAAGTRQEAAAVAAPPESAALTPPTATSARPSRAAGAWFGRGVLSLHRLLVRARDKAFSVGISGGFHAFGSHTVIQMPARLKNPQRIAIGSGAFVGAGSWLQVLDAEGGVALEIGDGASIAEGCVLSTAQSIRLGTKVSFARHVYVADHSHGYDDPTRPSVEQGITDVRAVEIGDGAWLGENVMVLPGVRIGKGAVVAANSVVSKDVPDFSVAAGAPARVVRRFA